MLTENLEKIVGKELMIIRKEAGYTINELAEKTNLAPSTISKYENAKNKMSIKTIDLLVKTCNSDMVIFFTKCIAKLQNQ